MGLPGKWGPGAPHLDQGRAHQEDRTKGAEMQQPLVYQG